MNKKTNNHDNIISTYARTLLSDWPVLASLIVKHSTPVKQVMQQSESDISSSPDILTEQQIREALNGPYQNFFKDKFKAYATIMRLQTELNIQKEESLKEGLEPAAAGATGEATKIPPQLLAKTTLQDLQNLQRQLDELTLEHNQQWEESLEGWSYAIINHLTSSGMPLSDFEITEILDKEPISELMARTIELKIELVKYKTDEMNFERYLAIKAQIAIQNGLSRQHKPHGPHEIKHILKNLKSDFASIHREEKNLFAEQQAATEQIIKPINFTKK